MPFSRISTEPMDCKRFRKNHLAYLDDTLSGDQMTAAQLHLLRCDPCAAHDTMVRRSLMVARSIPSLEPSAEFQARLRARLAECREAQHEQRHAVFEERSGRSSRTVAVFAASVMLGTLAWQVWGRSTTPELSMQPVIASQPDVPSPAFHMSPELIQAMATGNPIWSATLLMEDAPTQFVNTSFTPATYTQPR